MKRSNLIPIIQSTGRSSSPPRPRVMPVVGSWWQRSVLRHGSRRSLPPSVRMGRCSQGGSNASHAACLREVGRPSVSLPLFGRRWVVSEVHWRWIVPRFSSGAFPQKLKPARHLLAYLLGIYRTGRNKLQITWLQSTAVELRQFPGGAVWLTKSNSWPDLPRRQLRDLLQYSDKTISRITPRAALSKKSFLAIDGVVLQCK